MRRLSRPSLPAALSQVLASEQARVSASVDPKRAAKRRWKNKNSTDFDAVREVLRLMATGRNRCMYCEDNAGTDIEHFRPKATHPELAFTWSNYLLACSFCNSNMKRERFPLAADGTPLLIDPSATEPTDHLVLLPQGMFASFDAVGATSIDVFGLNRTELIQGRSAAWTSVNYLVQVYVDLRQKGHDRAAGVLLSGLHLDSFSSVRALQTEWALSGMPLLPDATRDAYLNYPELCV